MHLIPAYGRDYKSRAAVVADLKAGMDFIIADVSSPYCGKPVSAGALKSMPGPFQVRYRDLRQVAVINRSEIL